MISEDLLLSLSEFYCKPSNTLTKKKSFEEPLKVKAYF